MHGTDETAQRLLASAAQLSRDPETEIDWDAPVGDGYGLSPEWSTLYGTPYWYELILQQMILRDVYDESPASAEFQWALTEIADECRHSIMFAKASARLVDARYRPGLLARELGRGFKTIATGATAYAAILVAE